MAGLVRLLDRLHSTERRLREACRLGVIVPADPSPPLEAPTHYGATCTCVVPVNGKPANGPLKTSNTSAPSNT